MLSKTHLFVIICILLGNDTSGIFVTEKKILFGICIINME